MKEVLRKLWLLPLFICAIMSCVALTACGDDEVELSKDSNYLIGSWYRSPTVDVGSASITIIFNEDGSYFGESVRVSANKKKTVQEQRGQWKLRGEKIWFSYTTYENGTYMDESTAEVSYKYDNYTETLIFITCMSCTGRVVPMPVSFYYEERDQSRQFWKVH